MNQVKKIGEFLARTDLFFYTLLWLIVLLIAGTLAQRELGLYLAQQKYFSSWLLWLGFVPLPGGYTTLSAVFISLTAKLVFKTSWERARLGVIITHLGALLLLFGGFLTAMFSYEGSMVIREGQSANTISDYHKTELAVIDTSPTDHDRVTAFAPGWLKPARLLTDTALPFRMEILKYCRNCQMVRRTEPPSESHHGFALNFDLVSTPLSKEDEQNRAGVVFRVMGAGAAVDGVYAVIEFMPISQTILVNGKKYVFELRRAQTRVPFSVHLIDFAKEMYPGTEKAKSYQSTVTVTDTGVEQRSVIWMNHPLRYKNYTFFQASFIEGGPQETTVLAVVRNVGRIFPYVSSLVMCIGLLVHLLIQIPKLIQKRSAS